ncbi:alpha/beta hydrolase [Prochlorococcus sp. MIT 1307]|uniref:alpha/beta hydrolase n=1 Tax=Prochlorococcus sp. MIT 1307 TaxID=3096219 RepID=UPI002A749F55|nr:alpha/beta hydrolase [Prochlorococcus sp. MIT 1307]
MKQVIAMHGWSGDSNTWQLWIDQFQKTKWIWQSAERGYGTIPPCSPDWQESSDPASQRRVVIAHSLGLHLIKSQVLSKATDIVLLGSFSRFMPTGIERRYLNAALQSMKKHIGTTKEKTMLNNFLRKACEPEKMCEYPPGPIDKGLSLEGRKQLKADLELLIQTHELPTSLSPQARVLVVQGAEDAIVVPSSRNLLIEDLKKHLDTGPTHWLIPGASHLLLIPGLINRVENWLNTSP